GLGRAAVILQGAQQRVDVEQVGGGKVAAAAGVADQVMAQRAEAAPQVGGDGGRIAGEEGVPGVQRAVVVVNAAAGVAADGGVNQRDRAGVVYAGVLVVIRVVVNAAAVRGGVAADGGVGQRDRAGVRIGNAAAGAAAHVAA